MNDILEDLKARAAKLQHDIMHFRQWIPEKEQELAKINRMIEQQETLMRESAAFRAGNSLEQIMQDQTAPGVQKGDDYKTRPTDDNLTPKGLDTTKIVNIKE